MSAPFLREWNTQSASRYLTTATIVDHQTLVLDPYQDALGIDYALVDGVVYPDKAPYQPALAIPATTSTPASVSIGSYGTTLTPSGFST